MESARIKELEEKLWACDNPEVVDQFYSFGQFLLGEAQRQTEHLDTKLLMTLGWNGALLAFVMVSQKEWMPLVSFGPSVGWWMALALTLAFVGLGTSFLGFVL